nr:helix-turn-helix domain-containing protein [Halarchaeum nitratireducens]
MSLVDDRILEYIHENESGSPKEIMEEGRLQYSRQHVARRCRKLAEKGLLKHLGNAVYMITNEGEAYLEGRLDTQNWVYINNGDGSATSGVEDSKSSSEEQES